jgi:hypothetical protein
MSSTAPPIPPETARHVLWHYGQQGGVEPGSFTRNLITTIDSADMDNVARLAGAYPSLVAAVIAAKLDPDGIASLQRIAGAIRCARCGDTDGPWADDLCEDCNRVVSL